MILRGDRVIRRGTCFVAAYHDVERAADEVATFAPSLVAIEEPFVRVNPATGLYLARLLGRWLQAFERRGLPTATVLASTWQPVVLGTRITTRTPSAMRKAAAVAWARERFGVDLPEDEADAAGIAAWALARG